MGCFDKTCNGCPLVSHTPECESISLEDMFNYAERAYTNNDKQVARDWLRRAKMGTKEDISYKINELRKKYDDKMPLWF